MLIGGSRPQSVPPTTTQSRASIRVSQKRSHVDESRCIGTRRQWGISQTRFRSGYRMEEDLIQ
jgi:hypothetical protein